MRLKLVPARALFRFKVGAREVLTTTPILATERIKTVSFRNIGSIEGVIRGWVREGRVRKLGRKAATTSRAS